MKKKTRNSVLIIGVLVLLSSCFSNYTPIPKPKAYFEIPLPAKEYVQSNFDNCPFEFQYPKYGSVQKKELYFGNKMEDPCWFNIEFPEFNATLYFSYKDMDGKEDVQTILDETRQLTWHHTVKAEFIDERIVQKGENIHGIYYNVGGNAASSIQFYLTDSIDHFLRASLYFKNAPNIDSTKEVVQFLEQDIQYLIETFEWK